MVSFPARCSDGGKLLATLEEASTLALVEQLRTTRALSTMDHALTTAKSERNKVPLPCNCKVSKRSCFADVLSHAHNHFHKYRTQYPNSSHRVHHTLWLMKNAASVQTHALFLPHVSDADVRSDHAGCSVLTG